MTTAARRFLDFDVLEQSPREPDPLKGLIAGAVAGCIATLPMSLYEGRAQSVSPSPEGDWASEKVVRKMGEAATGEPPPRDVKQAGGVAAHFAVGAASGAVYGVLAEYWPPVTAGFGMPFGVAVKVLADDALLSATKLARPSPDRSARHHAFAIVSHLVFGASCEAARRAVRSALDRQ